MGLLGGFDELLCVQILEGGEGEHTHLPSSGNPTPSLGPASLGEREELVTSGNNSLMVSASQSFWIH